MPLHFVKLDLKESPLLVVGDREIDVSARVTGIDVPHMSEGDDVGHIENVSFCFRT